MSLSADDEPGNPEAMRNMETYRPAMDIVELAMMKLRMTTSHQELMWKNRSPVRSVKIELRSEYRPFLESEIVYDSCVVTYLHAKH